MATARADCRSTVPGSRTIALAISVVLSKPDGVMIREYIQHLRQHVAQGRRSQALSSTYRHLDRASYWRSQYEHAQSALKDRQGEVDDLRLEVEGLHKELDICKASTGAKKRKKGSVDAPAVESPKKPRHSATSSIMQSVGAFTEADSIDVAGLCEPGKVLMRSFYCLNAVLRDANGTDAILLASRCIQLASAVSGVIEEACKVGQHSPALPLKAAFNAASRATLALTMAYNRLTHVSGAARVLGKVTYAYVRTFAQLLDTLADSDPVHEAANESIESTGLIERPISRARSRTPAIKASTSSKVDAKVRGEMARRMLSKLISDMLTALNPQIEAHKELFEGYAFFVLKKLGATLYVLVFGCAREETVEAEIAREIPEKQAGNARSGQTAEGEREAAKSLAPLLIPLVKQVLTAAPAYLGSTGGALVRNAREKLQRTLVNCVFGTETVDGVHPMEYCLNGVATDDETIAVPPANSVDLQEWFTEEVWTLLGWDILSQDGDVQ